jgi:membrane protein
MGRAHPVAGAVLTVLGCLDRLQRRHAALGFAYAVYRKYVDDGGAREAALITYYGFLSIFPVLLLAVTVVSWVFAERPELRHRLVDAIVPPALQSTVEHAIVAMPARGVAFAVGVLALLLSGTGVVTAAAQTLNHLAGVPYRLRTGMVWRLLRAVAALVLILAGALTVGGLTVVVSAWPGLPWATDILAVLTVWTVVCVVLLLAARLLLARPAPMRLLWPAAASGAVAVTAALELGSAVLPGLIRQAGPIYGGFATVAGMFALLYLVSLALVGAAELGAVRAARLWPRAVDRRRPTPADAYALTLLAREQERLPGQRIDSRLSPASPD